MNTNCDKSRSVKLPTQKRIDSIDLFKGIAILGIVWKHTFHPQWCDLIHISALFFILSGIFFKDEPFIPFLKKKIRTILIPFLFFYILSYLARIAFYFRHFRTLHGFAWDSLLEIFSISNTPDYLTVNIPLWFLVCLFVMQIIFWCLNRVIPRNKYRSCWFLVILAALYAGYGTIESWHSPFMFNVAIECLPYFIAGNLFGLQIARFLSKSSLKYLLAPTCFALFIGFQYLPIDISILAFIKALTIFVAILSLLSCFENSCSMIFREIITLYHGYSCTPISPYTIDGSRHHRKTGLTHRINLPCAYYAPHILSYTFHREIYPVGYRETTTKTGHEIISINRIV